MCLSALSREGVVAPKVVPRAANVRQRAQLAVHEADDNGVDEKVDGFPQHLRGGPRLTLIATGVLK